MAAVIVFSHRLAAVVIDSDTDIARANLYFLFKRYDAEDFVLIGEDRNVFYGLQEVTFALSSAGMKPKLYKLGVKNFQSHEPGDVPHFDVELQNTHANLLSILGDSPVFHYSASPGYMNGDPFAFLDRLSEEDLRRYEIVSDASLPTPLFDERKYFLIFFETPPGEPIFKTPPKERIVVVGRLANCATDVALTNRRADRVWENPPEILIRVYVVNDSGVTQLGTPTVTLTPQGVLKVSTERGLLTVPRHDRLGGVSRHPFDEPSVASLGDKVLEPLKGTSLVPDFDRDQLVGLRSPTQSELTEAIEYDVGF